MWSPLILIFENVNISINFHICTNLVIKSLTKEFENFQFFADPIKVVYTLGPERTEISKFTSPSQTIHGSVDRSHPFRWSLCSSERVFVRPHLYTRIEKNKKNCWTPPLSLTLTTHPLKIKQRSLEVLSFKVFQVMDQSEWRGTEARYILIDWTCWIVRALNCNCPNEVPMKRISQRKYVLYL